MKVSFVTASVSRDAGGLYYSVRNLAWNLAHRPDLLLEIHGLDDRHAQDDEATWAPIRPTIHRRRGLSVLGYAPTMGDALIHGGFDLLHTHGIWQWPSAAVHEWHQRTKRPYLIAPRGMLDPWALARSRWKKWLVTNWYEAAHLRDAACLHALCASEAEAMRSYGLKNPICVIPNGIDVPVEEEDLRLEVRDRRPEIGGQRADDRPRILLFLGRLHPKKGLVNALKAWAEVRGRRSEVGGREDWQFVVAGWDQGGHEADLKRLCAELGLPYADVPAAEFVSRSPISDLRSPIPVIFTGPAFGEQKDQLLRRASAFILPSFSEGLPMSVLEAWSYRLPVLMTDYCNLPEGFLADAALRIGTDVTSIAEGMRLLLQSPASGLRSLGSNGRSLVERQFTWPQIAAQMNDVYEWVLGGGMSPGCVV